MRQITSRRFLTVITVILAALSFAQPGRPQSPSQKAPGRDMNRERVIWQRLEKSLRNPSKRLKRPRKLSTSKITSGRRHSIDR